MGVLYISTIAYNTILKHDANAFAHVLVRDDNLCMTIKFNTQKEQLLFEIKYGELISLTDDNFELFICVQKLWTTLVSKQ